MRLFYSLMVLALTASPLFAGDRARERAKAQAAVAVAMAKIQVCDCANCDKEACVGQCSTGGCSLKVETVATKPVVKATTASRYSVPARGFSGHTHTCANGHTWDHTMDGGTHRCPVCGLSQYIVDSGSMRGSVQSGLTQETIYDNDGNAKQVWTMRSPQSASGTSIMGGCSSGGCASGNCPTSYAPQRRGFRLFR